MPRVQLANHPSLNEEVVFDEIEILEEKPRRTSHGVVDGRYLRRTGRVVQINFKARLDTLVEIRRLMLRDRIASMAEFLEQAIGAYQAARPERSGSGAQLELELKA
jgi:hypothetical protein